MNGSINLSIINLSLSLLIGCGLLFYRFIFPKKKINLFILLLIISLLPLVSSLRQGAYESGDLSEHTEYALTFFKTIILGDIFPKWSYTCDGLYGCPEFEFLYVMPYYLIAFFHLFGFSFLASGKILLGTSFVVSGIGMYFWVKRELGKDAGFIAAIFYLFSPYHLLDMHIRSAVGEMVAFAILPFCFWFTKEAVEKKDKKWIVFLSISIAILITSHLVAALVSLPIIFLYGLFSWNKKKIADIFPIIASFMFGLLISGFYWLPIAFEKKYIFWGVSNSISFSDIQDLLFSPFKFGLLLQGPIGQQSHIIGYPHLILVIISIFLLLFRKVKNHHEKGILLFFLIPFLISIFMIIPASKPIWDAIPLIKTFQSSYRLLLFCSIATSIIAAALLKNVNKKIVFIVCFLTIFVTIFNWGNRRVIPTIDDNYLINVLYNGPIRKSFNTPSIALKGNYLTKHAINQLESLSGNPTIKQIQNLPTEREFVVSSENKSSFKLKIFYFPGWTLYVNGKKTSFDINSKKYPGLMIFNLPKGLYDIKATFEDTPIRYISKMITILSSLFIFLFVIVSLKKSKNKKS